MSDLYGYMENWRKAKNGQVFTPLHIAKFAARLIDVNCDDIVLDAACGSGALLYAAYLQGCKTLRGVEYDPDVKKIADDNFSDIDGIDVDIIEGDSTSKEVYDWVKEQAPTKLILNPPYERKFGCMKIVKNVIDALEPGARVAIFIPDKKFEKESKKYKKEWLTNHTINAIIKLPKNLFYGFSVEVSLFIITAHIPQDGKEIYTCYIKDDGFVSVKNKSPQDLKGVWENDKKDRYFNCIAKKLIDGETAQELDAKFLRPSENALSYKPQEPPFTISERDFRKTAFEYICFKQGIDARKLREKIADATCYDGQITQGDDGHIHISI